MKFSVPRNEIYKEIQKIFAVVPNKTTTPILYDILFELEENTLKLTATDLEILTSTIVQVNGIENGTIAIPAKFVNEILRELGNININFEMEDRFRVKLSTDFGEYIIVGDPGDDFPLMPVEEEMKSFKISQKDIQRMIEKSIFAASQDELRPALMGILFQLHSNEFRMVGTDGHRLSRIIKKNFDFDMEEQDFVVPTKALTLLDKNIESIDDIIQISFSNNFVIFDLASIKINSRLVESEYPDYEGVIPENNEKTLLVETSLLLGSIRRVSIFSSSLTRQVQFSIDHDKMEIFSQDIDVGGEGKETINVDFDSDPLEIGFNAQYFIDVLKHVTTSQVKLMLDTSITAVILLPVEQEEQEDFLMILMPVRLNEYYEESGEKPSEEVGDYYSDYSDEVDD